MYSGSTGWQNRTKLMQGTTLPSTSNARVMIDGQTSHRSFRDAGQGSENYENLTKRDSFDNRDNPGSNNTDNMQYNSQGAGYVSHPLEDSTDGGPNR